MSKCIIRSWKTEDILSLIENANNKKIGENLRDRFPYPYTQKDAEEWIKIANKNNPLTNFAIEIDGKAVGGIGIIIQEDVYRVNAEIGYWLGEKYWGKGIMTEALKKMTMYAFENFPLERLYAGVYERNKRSMKVLEKAGYKLECIQRRAILKGGEIMDCHLYSVIKDDLKR